jgi:hypothetical protein
MKPRKSMTLARDVQEILTDVATGPSSASAYVEALVRDAEHDWRTSLNHLREAGWDNAALCAACDVLNGYHLAYDPGRPATWAAMELQDAQALNGICAKWDLDPAEWTSKIIQVRGHELLARALLTLVREFWRHNARVDRAIYTKPEE